MLLNDLGKSPNTIFRKINQHLENNYGFKISEDSSDKDLVAIMEHIEDEITELKLKGEDAKSSSEISKRLLVLEGIQNLREYAALIQFQSPDLEKVLGILSDYVCDTFRISGTTHQDFEDCVRDCMKHYRSSKYRFPDDLVEQSVRDLAMKKIHNPGQSSNEEVITMEEPALETDVYAHLGKRAGAHGGYVPELDPAKLQKLKALDNPSLALEPIDGAAPGAEQPKMIRDKQGRLVPDPFDAQRIARQKGIVMKENLVKNLRRLLETEVSQAEVMMAAKGFAQELQEMIEKIGRLQNEDLPPVTDQMRETYGTDSSDTFQRQIYGALQSVMNSLYTAKAQVDDAVTTMAETGHLGAEVDMEKDVDFDAELDADPAADLGGDVAADPELDLDNLEGGDEFGGAEVEDPLGRSKKMESADLRKRVLEMKKLVAQAKRLKESKKK